MVFLSERKKIVFKMPTKKSLIVAVPSDFTSVAGRYLFQMETLFGFYFVFDFFICKIRRTDIAVS